MHSHHTLQFLTLYQLLDFHKFFQLHNLIGNVVMDILHEFGVAQACAHDHPGAAASEQLVVDWLKAAAIINGKDAVKAGLVEKDGKTLPMPRRMEGFVTHLADHDWVLSVPAAQWTVDALKQVAVRSYGIKEADLTKKPFNQFRNYVLSQKTAMQLYGAYSTKGLDGLTAEVAELVRA